MAASLGRAATAAPPVPPCRGSPIVRPIELCRTSVGAGGRPRTSGTAGTGDAGKPPAMHDLPPLPVSIDLPPLPPG